jgi:8-oxo-dGTP diphosphatase
MNELPLHELIRKGQDSYIPHLSVDCVIFGLHMDQLKVLILRLKNTDVWCLPGGHVGQGESVDEAALRVLKQRTGLDKIFLRQFKTFGAADRAYPEEMKMVMESLDQQWDPVSWLAQRFISIGYYALVDHTLVNPSGGTFSQEYCWEDVQQLPLLMMDHRQIIEEAQQALRSDLNNTPIGYNLLPDKFTMPELQRMYETILGIALERSHFQKKMLRLNIYERLEERKEGVAHKRPFLYRFKPDQYQEALDKGLKFDV